MQAAAAARDARDAGRNLDTPSLALIMPPSFVERFGPGLMLLWPKR
jgi:hypothetical protein